MKKHSHKKIKIISYSALTASIIGISASLASCTISVSGGEPTTPEVKLPIFDHSNISTPIISNNNTKDQFTIYGENLDSIESNKFSVKYQNQNVDYRIISSTNSQLKIQILNFKPTTKSIKEYMLSCYYDNQQVAKLIYNYEDVELPPPPPPVETKPEFDAYRVINADSNNPKQFTLTGRNLSSITKSDLSIRSNGSSYVDFSLLYSNSSSVKININQSFSSSTDLDCYYKQNKIATLKLVVQEPSFNNKQYNSDAGNRLQFTITGTDLNLVKTNKLKVVDVSHSLIDFDVISQSSNQIKIRLNQDLKENKILTLKYDGNQVATLNYLAAEKLPIFTENQNVSSEVADNTQFRLTGQNLSKVDKSLLVVKNGNKVINYEIVWKTESSILIKLTSIPETNASLDCFYNEHKFGTLNFVSWEPTFDSVENGENFSYIIKGNNLERINSSLFEVCDEGGRTVNSQITETSKSMMTLQLLQHPEESQTLTCYYKGRKVLELNYIAPEKKPIFNENNSVQANAGKNKEFNLTGQNLEKVDSSKFKVVNGQNDVAHSISNITSTQITVTLTNDLDQDATLNCYYDNQPAGTLVYKKPVVNPEPPKPEKPTVTIPDWQSRPKYSPHISSTLPRIDIHATELPGKDKVYKQFTADLIDDKGKTTSGLTGQIKVRGNSTSDYPKLPYRLKFDKPTEMFDMNTTDRGPTKAKNWVLLADWIDVSMSRNAIGLYLSQYLYREIGLYASDFRFVDLYMNGKYHGMYLLAEQNEVSEDRININKPDKKYTGNDIGYLLEMDTYAEGEGKLQHFKIGYEGSNELINWDNEEASRWPAGDPFAYAIKTDLVQESQRVFIRDYLENVYKICYRAITKNEFYSFNETNTAISKDSSIKSAKEAIERVVDLDSVIAVIILQEMICDYDVANSSFYLTVDLSPRGDGKVHFNAPWDFDNAFGNRKMENIMLGSRPANKLYAVNTNNFWLALFYKFDEVRKGITTRWNELKHQGVFTTISKYIDQVADTYVSSFKSNYDKWKNIGPYIEQKWNDKNDPDYKAFMSFYSMIPEASYQCNTQKDAANYLKQWWDHRVKVLDSIWTRQTLKSAVKSVQANKQDCVIGNISENRLEVKYSTSDNRNTIIQLSSNINDVLDESTRNSLNFTDKAVVNWKSALEGFSSLGNNKFVSSMSKGSGTFLGEIKEDNKETQYVSIIVYFTKVSQPTTVFNVVINSPKNRNEY